MRSHLVRAAVIALAILASACGRSPRVSFYTLSPGAQAEALVPGQAAPSVAVGPVTLPEVVDRPQLVVRVSENRVGILEAHRWAEPLKSEIPRLIAQNLGRQLGSSRVTSYGQNAGADAEYRVLVDVVRMESVPGEGVTVQANWTVRRTGSARRSGQSLVQEKATGAGYEALVAACSRAFVGVSGDIAKAIRAGAAD